MSEILTSRCPQCDQAPYMVMGGGSQAFCGNADGCPVMTWDPTKSREHFLETAREISIEQRKEHEDG